MSLTDDEEYEDRPRRSIIGPALVVVPSVIVAVLLILAIIYYSGAPKRISSLYTGLAAPTNQALATEMAGYTQNQHHDLAAAKAALADEVTTDNSFDSQLDEITFPTQADNIAGVLIVADQKRSKLLHLQMQATTLRKLRAFDTQDQAADAAVETQVNLIRQALGLPPSSADMF